MDINSATARNTDLDSIDYAELARAHLEDLCDRLDRGDVLSRGRWVARGVSSIVPVAMGLSLASCCMADELGSVGGAVYAGPPREIRDNGVDDNGNGLVDSADPECSSLPGCSSGVLYAGPPSEPPLDTRDAGADGGES